MSEAVKQISLKVFLLAVLWTFAVAFGPAALVGLMWMCGAAPRPDWPTLWHQSAGTGFFAALAFWRKHKAYLALPPTLERVKDLVSVSTTSEVKQQIGPNTELKATVTETHLEERH